MAGSSYFAASFSRVAKKGPPKWAYELREETYMSVLRHHVLENARNVPLVSAALLLTHLSVNEMRLGP